MCEATLRPIAATGARGDFQRARRRHLAGRAWRLVARRHSPTRPRDLGDVAALFWHPARLRPIPLDAIVGTVDATADFDADFRPTTDRLSTRWQRVASAHHAGRPLPPITAVERPDGYYVLDGRHRVSVARALGRDVIDAYVVEVVTRIGAERSLVMGDLPLKSHERHFYERAPIPSRARDRISLTDPWRYGLLAEMVEAWGFRAMQDRAEFIDRRTAARLWFDEDYVPIADMVGDAGMIETGETETDAYMRIVGQRYRLMRTHDWSEEILSRLRDEAP